jgi:hypothetical protein
MMRYLLLLCVFLFAAKAADAQHATRSGLHPPLDPPLNLSGNFGEFRSNHFHTGIDLKTGGREGLPVYAVQSGYVSRIKIQPYGYGNALYIDHPNGLTTVYAHLRELNPEIEAFLREAQYELESWEVDLYPGAGQLPVDSAEVIAWSGNSGSSGGPHLHFEIRETDTEFPLNPLLWDFPVADTRAPLLKGIQIVPLEDSSRVQGTTQPQLFDTRGSSGEVVLYHSQPIGVYGPVGIGVHTIDQLNGNSNICGIYRLKVFADGELIYDQRLDSLNFATNRFMNAHADYEQLKKERRSIHRTFRLPYNRLPIYRTVRNDGRLLLTDDEVHAIRVEVYDVHGNQSSVSFAMQRGAKAPDANTASLKQEGAKLLRFDQVNTLRSDSCNAYLPEGRLYEDCYAAITRHRTRESNFSAYYHVGNPFEPVHDDFILKLRSREVPEELQDKLLVVEYNEDRGRYYARGGEFKLGWVTTRVKSFGTYTLMMDTIAPAINVRRCDRGGLSFTITDDLSGIQRYEARVDGKWVRMHYEPKKARIWYEMEDGILTGESQSFELRVWDERGNEAVFTRSFE